MNAVARVEDFSLANLEIPIDRFYDLPPQTRELIRVYGRELYGRRPGFVTVEIAAYRVDEILASARVLGPGDRRVEGLP